ncbi:hypothetical protein [Streptomyces sp. NPDC056707]|uniref:hypothetical protein n=1 Tax=Streptomyces sp. NPDC056707 TaxID=3345919 RepID=UPI0036813178
MVVGESVRYPSECEDCGALAECDGGEGLVDGQVHWDITRRCAVCGMYVIACGRSDVPGDLRERLLAEHGPARLQLWDPSASAVALMKVLRAELGLDLIQAKAMVQRVRAGAQTGTLTEMEFLAHRLRQAGVQATTERP